VFPVRYGLNLYMLLRINSVFIGAATKIQRTYRLHRKLEPSVVEEGGPISKHVHV
jgi:hypothetical protein